MEEKCGQCHYFNSKDGICRNKQMQKECFQGDKDNILYVSREEQKCALFKAKMKNNRSLTPEILTAAGWECNVSRNHPYKRQFRKEGERFDEFCCDVMFVVFEEGKVSVYVYDDTTDHKADFRRNGQITVGEFNTLLDIVKLQKFKIK